MRWFWIDRFVEFERGRRAVAIKNVGLGDEVLDEYLPHYPIFPASLIIEGTAQTGGLLVGELSGFEARVILAKVGRAVFHDVVTPGHTLRYTVTIETLQQDGAIVKAASHVDDRLQAEIELVFAYLDQRFQGVELFDPADLLSMLRVLGLYDVGRQQDGSPLEVPRRLLAAEQALTNSAE